MELTGGRFDCGRRKGTLMQFECKITPRMLSTYRLSDGRIFRPGSHWIILNPEEAPFATNVVGVEVRNSPTTTICFACFVRGADAYSLTKVEKDLINNRIADIWPPYRWILNHPMPQIYNAEGEWINKEEWLESFRPVFFDPDGIVRYWVEAND